MQKIQCDHVRKISEMPSAAIVALDKGLHESYIVHRDSCNSCEAHANEQVAKRETPLPLPDKPASDEAEGAASAKK